MPWRNAVSSVLHPYRLLLITAQVNFTSQPSTLLSARPNQENRTSHRPVYLYRRLADIYILNSIGTKAVPAAKSSVQGASAEVNGEYEFAPSVLDYGRRNNFFGAENVFN